MATLQTLTEVFRDVFEDDSIELRPQTTANDVEGWDSLSHTIMISAVELKFGVKFSTREVMRLKNVGELVQLIDSKRAG